MQSARRQKFNPRKHDSSILSDDSDNSFNFSQSDDNSIVTKGKKDTLKVDMAKFSDVISHFRQSPHKRIDELEGADSDNFKLIVRYVELLYDTDAYPHLFKIVEDQFKDIDCVKPGTVGGYVSGCLVKSKFPIPGCSPVCSNAIPIPKGSNKYDQCDQAVLLAEKDGKGYKFNVLKQSDIENRDKPTIIHVNTTDVHAWSGFSKEEKDQLRSMDCETVHIYGYTDDCSRHVDLYGSAISLNDIKTRNVHREYESKEKISLAFILILIFLILIIAFFGWRLWNNGTY